MPCRPYAFIAQDYTTMSALYTHHQYIAGFLMLGAFAHGAIFLVRDYDPEANREQRAGPRPGPQRGDHLAPELGVAVSGLPHLRSVCA